MDKTFADALNIMTQNLRIYSLNQLRDQDLIGKIKDEQITSSFKLRSIEPMPGQAWTYQAFGFKEAHGIRNKSEFTDRIVGKYQVRLIQDRRSERVPSGLLVAEAGIRPAGKPVGSARGISGSGGWMLGGVPARVRLAGRGAKETRGAGIHVR